RLRQQRRGAFVAGHEVRRDEVERLYRPTDRPHELRKEQHVGSRGRVERLRRIVVHKLGEGPFQRQLAAEQVAHEWRSAHGLEVVDGLPIGTRRSEPGLETGCAIRSRRTEQGGGRIGGRTVPVEVELFRYLAYRRSHDDHVEIGEEDSLTRAEVLVADVASANN